MKKSVLLKTNSFICLIIVLGFIVTSVISYKSNLGLFKQDTENISALSSEGIYHQIDTMFTKPINISLTMANDSFLKDFLAQEEEHIDDMQYVQTIKNYLLAYKEKYSYDSVFLVSTATGRYYHFNGIDRILAEGNPENEWYYNFLSAGNEHSIKIDNDEAASDEITVFVNCAINNDSGNLIGVVGVGFQIDSLQEMLKKYESDLGINAYLINSSGTIEVSTNRTGYTEENLFSDSIYSNLKPRIVSDTKDDGAFWYSSGPNEGYLISKYIPSLDWFLIIDNDTTELNQQLTQQFMLGIAIIIAVIICVLLLITKIIRKYNEQIVQLTVEKERRHRTIFQVETAKIYENIYEIDITHNCAASEATVNYFKSLGVPDNTSYDEALKIVAQKQIKEEYRDGYLSTFSPYNVLKSYRNGTESLCYDFLITNDGGISYYWMRITAQIFYWDDDKSVRMFIYRQNVDEEKRRERYLFEKMESDSLTGLYNKAATQHYIQNSLIENKDKTYAFFMIDIDDFKNINDTFGHAFGDITIANFAQILSEQFTSDDVVGRIGGDEFAAFIPVSNKDEAVQKAENLIKALCHEFCFDENKCPISVSIGVAVSSADITDFETLYKNADYALYKTKKNGKNGYTIF